MKRIAVPLVLAGAVALAGCSKKAASAAARPAVPVQTLEVRLERTPDVREVVGTVRPKLAATVSARVLAAIREIPVRAGDAVGAGQTLATLDDRDLRAEFEKARADFGRYQKLLAGQAVTPAEFDAVRSRYQVAETALSHAVITAPFDGIVAEKLGNVGDMAAPGKPLFVIEQPTNYRLEAAVPERLAGALGVGQSVAVIVDATGEKCDGRIGEIVPAADPASRSILIKIDLACRERLSSGMFGRAQLLVGERFAIFVPKEAIRERGQLTSVMVAEEGRAQMRLVRTGKAYLDAVEILSGVQPGEKVIVAGEVADGQPVRP